MIKIHKKLTDFDIVKSYKERFERMAQTMQDSVHHQEGDVYTHTEMVLNELQNLPEYLLLSEYEQKILTYTAIFHDICKPETTEYLDDTKLRISHPRHARKGANLVRQILDKEDYAFDFIEKVYYMVLFHGFPFRIFDKQNPLKDVIKMSLLSNNKWLYIFAKADLLGRICADHEEMLYQLETYKEFCIENKVFGEKKAFASDYDRFYYFNQDDSYPDTNLYEDYSLDIYMLCGLPAAGKDSYLKTSPKHLKDLPSVHLDALREEFKISPTDNQGKIIQISRERSKEFCRKKQSFIWNATSLTVQIRATLVGIWLPYKPKIHIIYLHKNINKILADNYQRQEMAQVPTNKVMNMFERLEFPNLTEAHEISIIGV